MKKKFLNKEKAFVTIRRVYSHLSVYSDQEILDYYHVENVQALEAHIAHIKYILQQEIENYKEEMAEIDTCFCVDSKGEFKYLYTHKEKAQKQITHFQQTKGIKLDLYACPYHCGWHLYKL